MTTKPIFYILSEYLKYWGGVSTEAPNAQKALELLYKTDNTFNLIIVDFQMPEMNGLKLLNEIRKIEKLQKIPIIMLSSMGKKISLDKYKDAKLDACLTKPVKRDDLYNTILMVLNQNSN